MRTREHKLFVVRRRPQKYPQTPQQRMFCQVLDKCGIVKGITRDQLVDKMRNCIGSEWAKIKGAD